MLYEVITVKYEFALELGTIGGLQLRIYNKGECEPIAKLEIWNLDYYLMGSSLYLHKESMLEGIKDLTGQLQKIKALAKKYAKLNCN